MKVTKKKAIPVKDNNGQIVGWDTTCAACKKPVHFVKADTPIGLDPGSYTNPRGHTHTLLKPDDTARCNPCWTDVVRLNKQSKEDR